MKYWSGWWTLVRCILGFPGNGDKPHFYRGVKMQTNKAMHSLQVQSGKSTYPNVLPAWVLPVYIHSGPGIHPDIVSCPWPPMWWCIICAVGSNKFIQVRENVWLVILQKQSLQYFTKCLFMQGAWMLEAVLFYGSFRHSNWNLKHNFIHHIFRESNMIHTVETAGRNSTQQW